MYIAYIEEIDGFQIVTGVDKKGIEPFETEKIVLPLLEESNEMIALKNKNNLINLYMKKNVDIKANENRLLTQVMNEKNIMIIQESDLTSEQTNILHKYQYSKNFNNSEIEKLKSNLPSLNENLQKKKIQLMQENAVYQETAKNQIDITKNQYDDYKIKLISIRQYYNDTKKRRFLVSTGDIIDDNRGRVVWEKDDKWKKRTLQFLSDVKESLEIWETELTEEQKQEIAAQVENERIAALSPEDKEAEKNAVIDAALKESVQMRNELEIKDETDALQIAQNWYNAEVLAIDERYN